MENEEELFSTAEILISKLFPPIRNKELAYIFPIPRVEIYMPEKRMSTLYNITDKNNEQRIIIVPVNSNPDFIKVKIAPVYMFIRNNKLVRSPNRGFCSREGEPRIMYVPDIPKSEYGDNVIILDGAADKEIPEEDPHNEIVMWIIDNILGGSL